MQRSGEALMIGIDYMLIVSVLMLEKDAREKIFSGVRDEYLTDTGARKIFSVFRGIYEKHPDADGSAFLSVLDEAQKVPLSYAISEMMSPGIAESRLDDTISAVREQYISRRKGELISELMLNQQVSSSDVRRIADEIERLGGNDLKDTAKEYLLHYDEKLRRFPTGFAELDSLFSGGLAAGTVACIGARPSMGKTALALNIASADPERRVLFISIEMTAGMIFDRLVSDKAGVDYSLAVKHEVEKETVKAVIGRYGALTVVDDVSRVEDICSLISEKKPDLTVIDFVQIVTSVKKFPDNRQRIDHISQQLKAAAKASGGCIIILSQLTRNGKDKPTMTDLKESGGLEQDSDYVLILHRPYVNDKGNSEVDERTATLTLDKNKFGQTRELKFSFDGRHQRFTEISDSVTVRPRNAQPVSDDLPF